MSTGQELKFLVILTPKVGWADEIFLGNMLMEALGAISRRTGAFEFRVEAQGKGTG